MRRVTVEASEAVAEPPQPEREEEAPSGPSLEARIASALLALLPGAIVVYFSFSSGGFFPSSVGFATLLVIQMLVLRVLVVEQPFAGYTRRFGVVACLLTGYAGWTLASQLWSDTQDRALIEFDRALLYLALFVLFGLLPRPKWRMPWITRGLAAAIAFVCTCALITRALPHVWPTDPGFADNRLSFPLTYWNSLGILAAIGAVLLLGILANPAEHRLVRAGAAAFVPITATTLLFTFSRGAILAAIIGVVVYLCVARSSSLVSAVIAVGPPTAVALVVAYDANLLATLDPTQPGAIPQGRTVAITVLACALGAAVLRLLTLRLDRRLAARKRAPWTRQRRLATAGALGAVIVIAAVAVGVPGWIEREYQGFNSAPTQSQDLRSRLTDPSSNGRTDHWHAAFQGFSDAVFKGHGAGTYQFTWNRERRTTVAVVDAHSLYFEVLSELGIVGFTLLVLTIGTILFSLFRRIQGPNRMTYAALFAAAVAWALHAGIDWDWEMPAVTAWFFAIGGAAVAGRATKRKVEPMGDRGRIPIAAALLVVAVTPALLMLSQYRLQAAANAFDKGEWKAATSDATDSINILAVRAEPYQILGYGDLSNGRVNEAIEAMKKAVDYEPRNWEFRYSLAIAQAHAGIDPLPQLNKAAALNPREPLVRDAITAFQGKTIPEWLTVARRLDGEIRVSGRLTLR
jgi:O-antigen ligase/polysaccharide polymerase Wzy-like membrane protein